MVPVHNVVPDGGIFCSVCAGGYSPLHDRILLCDSCDTPYHQRCHVTPVDDAIAEDSASHWFCHECENTEKASKLAGEETPYEDMAFPNGEPLMPSFDPSQAGGRPSKPKAVEVPYLDRPGLAFASQPVTDEKPRCLVCSTVMQEHDLRKEDAQATSSSAQLSNGTVGAYVAQPSAITEQAADIGSNLQHGTQAVSGNSSFPVQMPPPAIGGSTLMDSSAQAPVPQPAEPKQSLEQPVECPIVDKTPPGPPKTPNDVVQILLGKMCRACRSRYSDVCVCSGGGKCLCSC